MPINFLVTGGAGFIGSHIVEKLATSQTLSDVGLIRILDNLSTGNKNNIAPFLDYKNVEFMYGDITNLETCRKAVQNMDVICHQAAIGSVPRSLKEPLNSHYSNVNGFLNILVSAKEQGIKRIVYASSSSVYGDSVTLPKVEEEIGKQLSPYALTKYIDELYANMFTKCYGLECIGLRYFNVFGPRQDPNGSYAAVIPRFIQEIKEGRRSVINGDGSFSRDFTYVDNVVQANINALITTNTDCFGEVFNIGAGGRITIKELFSTIKKELNSDIEPIYGPKRVGDIPHSNASIDKAISLLKYKIAIPFSEGIKLTISSYNL